METAQVVNAVADILFFGFLFNINLTAIVFANGI